MQIGVLSDTHGYLDPRVPPIFAGVDHILHAGDIGSEAVLATLRAIAPLTAVQGNIDVANGLARHFPVNQHLLLAGVPIFMTHVGGKPERLLKQLPDPRPLVYIFGHSHRSLLEDREGVIFLNPGAAGRPRFGGGLSVALLTLQDGQAHARLVPLQ